MTSYILKKSDEKQDILLYQEKHSYSFTPKNNYKWVKKITILDEDMLSSIWENKLNKDYNRLLKIIYSLVSSDDTNSGDVLVAYTEIERIRQYLNSLQLKGLKQDIYEKFVKKLYVLELELKKIHVMELKDEIEERDWEHGKSR